MTKEAPPQIFEFLPRVTDREILQAALSATKLGLTELATPDLASATLRNEFQNDERSIAFIDMSARRLERSIGFDRLLRNIPRASRPRKVLTRWAGGHAHSAERAWVKSLGFADLMLALGLHKMKPD